jgi:hypothetical protein
MQPFAAGRIIRHDRDVNSFDKGSWAGVILGQVETVNPELTPDVAAMASNAVVTPGLEPFTSDDWEQFDTDTLLDRMRDQTRTDHNWPLIHLLCLTYIGLIFPGGWLLSRWRPGDYRLLFGGLLGLVTLFSLLLLVVGRRGAGEVETIHSLLLARTLDKERVSVSGWSGAFVATSGTYPLSHAGQGGLYSTGQQIEGVDGFITTQPPAHLEVTPPVRAPMTWLRCVVPARLFSHHHPLPQHTHVAALAHTNKTGPVPTPQVHAPGHESSPACSALERFARNFRLLKNYP